VARGLCSAHYQQWRYRERKSRLTRRPVDLNVPSTQIIPREDEARDN
jgi:hypothetical protein